MGVLARIDTDNEDAMDARSLIAEVVDDYPRLVRSVALFCGDVDEAEDAVQEALARLWERRERGESIQSPLGWVAMVATNQTRSVARRAARRRRHLSLVRPEIAVDDTRRVAEIDAVRTAVLRLPRRQREVVVLHYYLDHSVREMSDLLHLSEGAVKNALHNARSSLARELRLPDVGDEIDVHS
jgi:RNA polymerase sigma factor (sigma-70 family)